MNSSFEFLDYLIFSLYAFVILGVGLWVSRTKDGKIYQRAFGGQNLNYGKERIIKSRKKNKRSFKRAFYSN